MTSSVDNYASKLVHRIVNDITYDDESHENHQSEEFLLQENRKRIEQNTNAIILIENEDQIEVKNIDWPSVKQFNESHGAEKIDEFIKKTWQYDDCWLYCVDFVEKIEHEFNNLYNYRVTWSIPTRRKPIPRFTVNVYFTYDVSKIKPKDSKVDVTYVFETQKLVHKPGKSRFRQEWLYEIINLKESLISNCKF